MVLTNSDSQVYLEVDTHLGYRLKPEGFNFEGTARMLSRVLQVPYYETYRILEEYIDNKILASKKIHKLTARLEEAVLEIKSKSNRVEDVILTFTESVSLEDIGTSRRYSIGIAVLVKE